MNDREPTEVDGFIANIKSLEEDEFYRFDINGKSYCIFPTTFYQQVSKKTPPGIHNTITFDYTDDQGNITKLSVIKNEDYLKIIKDKHQKSFDELKKIEAETKQGKIQDVLIFFILLSTVILSLNRP